MSSGKGGEKMLIYNWQSFCNVWTFNEFEKLHGKFVRVKNATRTSDNKDFKLCLFYDEGKETRASLYSKIDILEGIDIERLRDELYVGQLSGTERYVVLDSSWEDWKNIMLESSNKNINVGFLYKESWSGDLKLIYKELPENGYKIKSYYIKETLPFCLSLDYRGCNVENPVLFTKEGENNISIICKLSDLEIRESISEKEDFYFYIRNEKAKLYYGRQELLKDTSDTFLKDINTLAFQCNYLRHKRNTLQEKGEWFSNNYQYRYEQITNLIKNKKEYIKSFNIVKILEGLSIEIKDYFHSKVGGDDRYDINRVASIKDKNAEKDFYINTLIGIGDIRIYEDRGIHFLQKYAENFIKEHPLGKYTGELLRAEQDKILRKYNKEDHFIFLLTNELCELKEALHSLVFIEKELSLLRCSMLDILMEERGLEE